MEQHGIKMVKTSEHPEGRTTLSETQEPEVYPLKVETKSYKECLC
jgi:hypothetical protein